ncbi:MAG: rhodanese-like domain-containing protein [Acidobacteriota bacterium]
MLSRLGLNQKLALAAFVLGVLAIAASPYRGTTATIDTKALALEVATEADHVEPLDLAAWVIAGRADYRLVDLRGEPEFGQYQIPTAEHFPLATLMEAGLGRNEKIILYSDGGVHSAQAWLLLRASGYKAAYVLEGGLDEWKEQVLFPILAEHPNDFQRARDERLKSVAAFFGGQPRTGSRGGPVAMPMPGALPAPSVVGPASPGGARPAARKKKEGC